MRKGDEGGDLKENRARNGSHGFLYSLPHSVFSCIPCYGFRSNFALFPVIKDTVTLQYAARISHATPLRHTDLVVDLGGSFRWMDCDSGHVSSSNRLIPSCSVNCSRAKFNEPGNKSCLLNTNCNVFPNNGRRAVSEHSDHGWRGKAVQDAH
ncbi:hypothetical protein F3Y22_tig00116959pilonHSYRG00402 [Hibiscus syriacus]|uniref:Xylanase inhibitor N-terminal domain-containing protein n=1 Tax=Hibiscus syriacus TaxID=106335 RepID=A0A6A2XZ13_HIBSY|nr:hypothetical protein F3Y22_tig00116959pilonHSYRG00402 [Hibiscus syriacus]